MSRGLALLFGAGAALVSVTLLLPHRHGEARAGLLIPVALAVIVVALLLAFPRRWLPRVHSVTLAFGSALIAVCVHYGGNAGGVYAFMFVWVALYAAAFLSVRATVAHLQWACAAYALVLATGHDVRPPGAHWLMAAGTSAVVSALVLGLTRELRARAADLTSVTHLANVIGSASEIGAGNVARRICEAVRASTRAGAVVLLEETSDRSGLHVLGDAGEPQQAAPLEEPERVALLDAAYRSGAPRELTGGGGVTGVVQPVRRDGRVAGLLIVVWPVPRRRVTTRVRETVSLFAAEAGVALERIAHQAHDRERRALELNDEIVQGLVVAHYALRDGRVAIGEQAIGETLDRARALVDSQLQDLHGGGAPEPGSLRVRRRRDG